MDPNLRIKLSQLHPVFRLNQIQFIWCNEVQKVNRKTQTENIIFLITSYSIFLISQRKFPSGYRIISTIPYNMISGINAKKDNLVMEIYNLENVEIIHKDAVEIAKIIADVYSTLLDDTLINDKNKELNKVNFKWRSPHLLADKFLVSCKITLQVFDLIKTIFEDLLVSKVVLNQELLSSQFLNNIINVICTTNECVDIEASDISYNVFLKYYQSIKEGKIRSLKFYKISFCDIPTDYVLFSSNNIQNSITKLSFEKCDLTHNDFKIFINDLVKYKGLIKKLILDFSKINDVNLRLLFNLMYEAESFHYLEELYINQVNITYIQVLLVQLLGNNNFLVNKCFKVLDLNSCEINVNNLLPLTFMFQIGLKKIIFTNCDFIKPIDKFVTDSFQSISYLDFSHCNFSTESLHSLFSFFSNTDICPSIIILNDIKLVNGNFNDFYKQIYDINLNRITKFHWESNPIGQRNYQYFFDFLKKQTTITELNLSYSIVTKDESTINYFLDTLKCLNLETFIFKGNDEVYFEKELYSILNVIKEQKCIKTLDITGQHINVDSIEILLELISTSLTSLIFDKTYIESKSLLNLLKSMINSNLIHSKWPINDVKRTIELNNNSFKQNIGIIENEFIEKFGENEYFSSLENGFDRETTYQNTLRKACSFDYQKYLSQNEDYIQPLIKECLGNEVNLNDNDPLIVTYNLMMNSSA